MLDVLLVDDDDNVRESVAGALLSAGHKVTEASRRGRSGRAAVEPRVRPGHLRRAACPGSTAWRCSGSSAARRRGRPWSS